MTDEPRFIAYFRVAGERCAKCNFPFSPQSEIVYFRKRVLHVQCHQQEQEHEAGTGASGPCASNDN